MRIRDRQMKILSYISILIIFVLGCAGRSDKVKVESIVFEPAYPELIEIYNEGQFNEFYSALDTVRIMGLSGFMDRLKSADRYTNRPRYFNSKSFTIEVTEDNALVTILILDIYKCLKRIELNQILPNGTHIYTCDFIELFRGLDMGLYYYLIKIGSKENLMKEVVIK